MECRPSVKDDHMPRVAVEIREHVLFSELRFVCVVVTPVVAVCVCVGYSSCNTLAVSHSLHILYMLFRILNNAACTIVE